MNKGSLKCRAARCADRLIRFALLAPFIVAMVIHGGSKPGPGQRPSRFTMDEYLTDTGSYSTNSTVHIAATKLSAQIPDDTPLLAYAALMGTTNWTELLPRRTYADLPADWSLPDATNYDYIVGLDWAPPIPVVTNDILLVNALAAKDSTPPGPTLSAVLPAVEILPIIRVEYIRNVGNSYIDTGIKLNLATMTMGARFRPTGNITGNTWSITFGSRSGKMYAIIYNNGYARSNFDYSVGGYMKGTSCTPAAFTTVECVVDASTHTVTGIVDGNVITNQAASTGTTAGTAWLYHTSDAARNFETDVAEFWIKEGGEYLIHLYPARLGSTGAFFDTVSGRFFHFINGGCVLGPDL